MNQESSASQCVDSDRLILDQFSKAGKKSKIELLPSESVYSMTFCIWEEDHTIGNALRHMIMKNPNVVFCGYSLPHPSEAKIHLRIQTHGPTTAGDALLKGLEDLKGVVGVIQKKFNSRLQESTLSS